MNILARLVVKGLSAILPVSVVIFFVYWIGTTAETALGALLKRLLPAGIYVPGMGLMAGFVLAILAGLLVNVWLVRRLVERLEAAVARLPLGKSVLQGIRDLISFFEPGRTRALGQCVVSVDLDEHLCVLGIMTRADMDGSPLARAGDARCAVYLPMSYQMGGYTVYVPRERVRPVAMSVADAMRFTLTGGVSVPVATGSGLPPEEPAP